MKARDITLAGLFAALTAVGAYIRIPIPYVPFTLQFFFCAMAGLLLGSRLGMLSQIVYVAVGLCGVPVFTKGGGPGYIFEPTFGYLIGFILCAFIIGKIVENYKEINFIKIYLTSLLGLMVIYLIGVPYMYMLYNFYLGGGKTVWWAIYWGFLTSIGGDLILIFILTLLALKIMPILRKNGLILGKEA